MTIEERDTAHAIQSIARNQLTVRDQFAVAALNAIIAKNNNVDFADLCNSEEERDRFAKLSYKMADAMMKARKD